MKKLFFIITILFLMCYNILSQQNSYSCRRIYNTKQSSNYISINFCTSDYGYGLRYDKNFSNIGIYTSLLYTNLPSDNIKSINNHIKFEPGLNVIFTNWFTRDIENFLFTGISYNYYFNHNTIIYNKNYDITAYKKPVSINIGAGMLVKKIMFGFSANFFTKEFITNFGVKLW